MAYKQVTLYSETFGELNCCSFVTDYFNGGSELYNAYSEGISATNTVVNMRSLALTLSTKAIIPYETMRTLTSPIENYQAEEIQQMVTACKLNFYFIWGSWDKGGLYARRYTNNTIVLGVMVGLCQYTEGPNDGYYFYNIAEDTYNDITATEASQIAIGFNGDSDLQKTPPDFWIQYRRDDRTIATSLIDTNSVLSATYNEVEQNSSVAGALNNYMWTDDAEISWQIPPFEFNAKPVQIWEGNGAIAINCSVPTGSIIISGSWDGGAIVNDAPPGGSATPGGGDGNYPNSNSPVDFSNPTGGVDAINSGLVTIYNPSKTALQQFSKFLFVDITEAMSDALKKLIVSPYDYILYLALIRFPVPLLPAGSTIQFCGLDSMVGSMMVAEQFINIGTYNVYVPNDTETFMDFNPYSKASIYLPYIGYKELDIDDIRGCTCSLQYHVDLLNGSCIAELKVTRDRRVAGGNADNGLSNVLYNWSGTLFDYIPISATDYRSFLNAGINAIGAGISTVGGVLTNNPGALTSALNMAGSALSAKQNIQKSNGIGSSFGYMGKQYPYIILERPIICYPNRDTGSFGYTYEDEHGIPTNQFYKVSELEGYVEAEFDTLYGNDINGLAEEINEIKELFNTGVYLDYV